MPLVEPSGDEQCPDFTLGESDSSTSKCGGIGSSSSGGIGMHLIY